MDVKLYVVFVLACTLFRSAQGITGADYVKIEDFSYNAIVLINKTTWTNLWMYSGSIIHKRFVLTSALPFMNITRATNTSMKAVRFSNEIHEIAVQVLTDRPDHEPSEGPQKYKIIKVTKLYLPQKWIMSDNYYGDAAILELEKDLDLSRGIRILKLPTMDLHYMKDYEKFAVFTGFGRIEGEAYSNALRSMEINIEDCPTTMKSVNNTCDFCGNAIILHKNINNSRNQTLGISWGDAGGPLVYRKDTIIGILHSKFDEDNRLGQNNPASFTNIFYHIDFINDVFSGQPSLHITTTIPLMCTAK